MKSSSKNSQNCKELSKQYLWNATMHRKDSKSLLFRMRWSGIDNCYRLFFSDWFRNFLQKFTWMPCPSMWPKQFWSVQNGFHLTKLIWTWPNWFGLDHNDLVSTKMKWSQPKLIGQVQIVIFYQNESHLDLTNSFWSWPNHYGQVQINLVRPKSFWTDQNCFGHIERQGIRITSQYS